MPYVSNTENDRQEMLKEIGASSIEELFSDIPADLRVEGDLNVPGPLSEIELVRHMEMLAGMGRRGGGSLSFLGGGIYDHSVPAVVRHITGMPQFYTAYTPYQAEVSQGTLQSIYEFQSLIARLAAMDVANASMYDGATAAAEAVLLAISATRKRRVLVSGTVSPSVRTVVRTYLESLDADIVELPVEDGVTSVASIEAGLEDAACLLVQHPNFLGLLEPVRELSERLDGTCALFLTSVDPLSLAVLRAPGDYGAAIAVGEGQCLGSPVGYGGPLLGFMAARKQYLRKLPGRIVGATADAEGRRGYVMTLQTREQHIRREKATSNICTNEGLVALAATVYLSLLGRTGFRELATHVTAKAHYAADALAAVPGVSLRFDRPFFREFVVDLPFAADHAQGALAEAGIRPGIACGKYYHGMERSLLVSVTEKHSRRDIDTLASGLAAIVATQGRE